MLREHVHRVDTMQSCTLQAQVVSMSIGQGVSTPEAERSEFNVCIPSLYVRSGSLVYFSVCLALVSRLRRPSACARFSASTQGGYAPTVV